MQIFFMFNLTCFGVSTQLVVYHLNLTSEFDWLKPNVQILHQQCAPDTSHIGNLWEIKVMIRFAHIHYLVKG